MSDAVLVLVFFFSSRRRHTRYWRDWSSDVCSSDLRQAALNEITAAHPGMRGIQLDVEDSRAVDAFAATIQEEFPGLNVLVNNAGITRAEDLTAESIDVSVPRSIIQTNIVSAIQLTAKLLPVLNRQPSATIIGTSSGPAFVQR